MGDETMWQNMANMSRMNMEYMEFMPMIWMRWWYQSTLYIVSSSVNSIIVHTTSNSVSDINVFVYWWLRLSYVTASGIIF